MLLYFLYFFVFYIAKIVKLFHYEKDPIYKRQGVRRIAYPTVKMFNLKIILWHFQSFNLFIYYFNE